MVCGCGSLNRNVKCYRWGPMVSMDESFLSESPQLPSTSTYVLEDSSNVTSFPLCAKEIPGVQKKKNLLYLKKKNISQDSLMAQTTSLDIFFFNREDLFTIRVEYMLLNQP